MYMDPSLCYESIILIYCNYNIIMYHYLNYIFIAIVDFISILFPNVRTFSCMG